MWLIVHGLLISCATIYGFNRVINFNSMFFFWLQFFFWFEESNKLGRFYPQFTRKDECFKFIINNNNKKNSNTTILCKVEWYFFFLLNQNMIIVSVLSFIIKHNIFFTFSLSTTCFSVISCLTAVTYFIHTTYILICLFFKHNFFVLKYFFLVESIYPL